MTTRLVKGMAGVAMVTALGVGVTLGMVGSPFGSEGGGSVVSTAAVQAAVIGESLSVNDLVCTEADTSTDGLTLNGARLRLRMNGDNDTWIQATDSGVWLSQPLRNCAGCVARIDALVTSSTGIPVRVDETKGFNITCKASLDTCNGTLGQGTQQTACASATSRTRVCTCTASSDTAPTFAWALSGGAGTVGNATTCPDVAP